MEKRTVHSQPTYSVKIICRTCFSPGDWHNDHLRPVICRIQFPYSAADLQSEFAGLSVDSA